MRSHTKNHYSDASDTRTPSITYERALRRCSAVARKEFEIANEALAQSEEIARKLLRAATALARRTSTGGGTVQAASERLHELKKRLGETIEGTLVAAQRGLTLKQFSLNRFTVTLYGRTMAGKSTVREALTGGDGGTIGKGAQRTTRDVREYTWHSLRILDTPGIGAFEGEEDCALAASVIDETDLVLFLVSSDGIQEDTFKGMQALRQQNKPILFILNVKQDLSKPVLMRRFLKNPANTFDEAAVRGHVERIHELAGTHLEIREIRVIPVHAQAAFLSTRPEYRDVADKLERQCRMHEVLAAVEQEVMYRGAVRRLQTLVDGTVTCMLGLQDEFGQQARVTRKSAHLLGEKLDELEAWFERYIASTEEAIQSEVTQLLRSLRDEISIFIDENIEENDVGRRWKKKVDALSLKNNIAKQQQAILDQLRDRMEEFSRELTVESALLADLDVNTPDTFDPWDVKRSLQWLSAGATAVGGVAGGLLIFGGANIWNPIGWIAGTIALGALGLSLLFDSREQELQRQKAKVAKQLRTDIDLMEKKLVDSMRKWFHSQVVNGAMRRITAETRQLYNGLGGIARELEVAAHRIAAVIERLDRRLLLRTGELMGTPVAEERIAKVVRDPGIRAKLKWSDREGDPDFCRQVGLAISERIDGVPDGSLAEQVVAALRPAIVPVGAVTLVGEGVQVHMPHEEMGRAIGRRGSNVTLASRLLGLPIKVILRENNHG
ncbi:MAG: GTPase [Pseudomonadota bacterium]